MCILVIRVYYNVYSYLYVTIDIENGGRNDDGAGVDK